MVSIGIKVYGIMKAVPENHVPDPKCYYETRQELDRAPPQGQERDFLLYIKQKLETEENVKVVFAEVIGNRLTIQWKVLGSPVSVSTIIALIIAAVIVFGLVVLARETYQILTFLGPEMASQIVQMLSYLFLLFMIMTFMSMISRFMVM